MQPGRLRSVAALALISVMLLAGAGCWDRREINDLNVATMIGFDRDTGSGRPKIVLTVLTLKIGATGTAGTVGSVGGGAPPTLGQAVSVEGETIADAVRNFTLRSSRQLYLGHVLGVVIGEDLARQGIAQVIDYVNRDVNLRYRSEVAVCEGTALEALQAQPEYEALLSTELKRMIEHNTQFVSKAVPATLLQVIQALLTPGRDVIMPRIHLFTPPERGSVIRKGPPAGIVEIDRDKQGDKGNDTAKGEESKDGAGVNQTEHPEKKTLSLAGSGVFLGERLEGWLNGDESMGVLLITDQAHGGAIPFSFKSSEKNASFVFPDIRTNIKPVITPEGITFEVSVRGSGTLSEEGNNAGIEPMQGDDLKTAERLIDGEAQHYCQEAVAKCQSLKSDVFGFGEMIHRTNPAAWKQIEDRWQDCFPTVRVRVTADFTIKQTGVSDEPFRTR